MPQNDRDDFFSALSAPLQLNIEKLRGEETAFSKGRFQAVLCQTIEHALAGRDFYLEAARAEDRRTAYLAAMLELLERNPTDMVNGRTALVAAATREEVSRARALFFALSRGMLTLSKPLGVGKPGPRIFFGTPDELADWLETTEATIRLVVFDDAAALLADDKLAQAARRLSRRVNNGAKFVVASSMRSSAVKAFAASLMRQKPVDAVEAFSYGMPDIYQSSLLMTQEERVAFVREVMREPAFRLKRALVVGTPQTMRVFDTIWGELNAFTGEALPATSIKRRGQASGMRPAIERIRRGEERMLVLCYELCPDLRVEQGFFDAIFLFGTPTDATFQRLVELAFREPDPESPSFGRMFLLAKEPEDIEGFDACAARYRQRWLLENPGGRMACPDLNNIDVASPRSRVRTGLEALCLERMLFRLHLESQRRKLLGGDPMPGALRLEDARRREAAGEPKPPAKSRTPIIGLNMLDMMSRAAVLGFAYKKATPSQRGIRIAPKVEDIRAAQEARRQERLMGMSFSIEAVEEQLRAAEEALEAGFPTTLRDEDLPADEAEPQVRQPAKPTAKRTAPKSASELTSEPVRDPASGSAEASEATPPAAPNDAQPAPEAPAAAEPNAEAHEAFFTADASSDQAQPFSEILEPTAAPNAKQLEISFEGGPVRRERFASGALEVDPESTAAFIFPPRKGMIQRGSTAETVLGKATRSAVDIGRSVGIQFPQTMRRLGEDEALSLQVRSVQKTDASVAPASSWTQPALFDGVPAFAEAHAPEGEPAALSADTAQELGAAEPLEAQHAAVEAESLGVLEEVREEAQAAQAEAEQAEGEVREEAEEALEDEFEEAAEEAGAKTEGEADEESAAPEAPAEAAETEAAEEAPEGGEAEVQAGDALDEADEESVESVEEDAEEGDEFSAGFEGEEDEDAYEGEYEDSDEDYGEEDDEEEDEEVAADIEDDEGLEPAESDEASSDETEGAAYPARRTLTIRSGYVPHVHAAPEITITEPLSSSTVALRNAQARERRAMRGSNEPLTHQMVGKNGRRRFVKKKAKDDIYSPAESEDSILGALTLKPAKGHKAAHGGKALKHAKGGKGAEAGRRKFQKGRSGQTGAPRNPLDALPMAESDREALDAAGLEAQAPRQPQAKPKLKKKQQQRQKPQKKKASAFAHEERAPQLSRAALAAEGTSPEDLERLSEAMGEGAAEVRPPKPRQKAQKAAGGKGRSRFQKQRRREEGQAPQGEARTQGADAALPAPQADVAPQAASVRLEGAPAALVAAGEFGEAPMPQPSAQGMQDEQNPQPHQRRGRKPFQKHQRRQKKPSGQAAQTAPETPPAEGASASDWVQPTQASAAATAAAGKAPQGGRGFKAQKAQKDQKPRKAKKPRQAFKQPVDPMLRAQGGAVEGILARPADELSHWSEEDDNFGNSIHYRPKHPTPASSFGFTGLTGAGWQPQDPYDYRSQALTLPQRMPGDAEPHRASIFGATSQPGMKVHQKPGKAQKSKSQAGGAKQSAGRKTPYGRKRFFSKKRGGRPGGQEGGES